MKPVKPVKRAKPAAPAKKAKPAKPAKRAKRVAALAALAALALCAGCAVVRGRAGDSSYTGWAFGEKTSTTLAGLNITETQNDGYTNILERGVGVDSAGSLGETDVGKILGTLLLLGLQSQGAPAVAAAPAEQSAAAAAPAYSTPAATSGAPRSVVSGEGGAAVAILGNRATCGLCRALWAGVDPQALSAALGGAAIIDADASANPGEYSRLRPAAAFKYPLVRVYDTAGQLVGEFVARGMDQAALTAAVMPFIPAQK